jgi:hypothetical protein
MYMCKVSVSNLIAFKNDSVTPNGAEAGLSHLFLQFHGSQILSMHTKQYKGDKRGYLCLREIPVTDTK